MVKEYCEGKSSVCQRRDIAFQRHIVPRLAHGVVGDECELTQGSGGVVVWGRQSSLVGPYNTAPFRPRQVSTGLASLKTADMFSPDPLLESKESERKSHD